LLAPNNGTEKPDCKSITIRVPTKLIVIYLPPKFKTEVKITMKTKQQKGKEIAQNAEITYDGKFWIVPSQAGKGEYQVNLPQKICSCPDFEKNKTECKHQFAVEENIRRQIQAANAATATVSKKNNEKKRNWKGYNEAQTKERGRWLELLFELCRIIPEPPPPPKGRKPLPISVILFSLILKIYERNCSRRTIGYLDDAVSRGLISQTPHFNSITNYLRKDWMTEVLTDLITASSLPLKAIETRFSVDSSGFGTSTKERWYDVKYGNNEDWHNWLKVHLICGNLTKIVVGVIITPAYSNDSPFLINLVSEAAKNFKIDEVLADAAYSSKENLEFVTEKTKAKVYIPFKSNAKERKDSEIWNKLLHYFSFHRSEFHEKYKYRGNVETNFSAIKIKFGDNLRCINEQGQTNELLAKIICHNLSVLIRSFYELGIDLEEFQPFVKKSPTVSTETVNSLELVDL
jgi:transposase